MFVPDVREVRSEKVRNLKTEGPEKIFFDPALAGRSTIVLQAVGDLDQQLRSSQTGDPATIPSQRYPAPVTIIPELLEGLNNLRKEQFAHPVQETEIKTERGLAPFIDDIAEHPVGMGIGQDIFQGPDGKLNGRIRVGADQFFGCIAIETVFAQLADLVVDKNGDLIIDYPIKFFP